MTRSGPASGDAAGQLTLTARLNTSAVDSRRGVIRLHPNAVAALGIREWDAVSLTGSRTTAAVAGLADPETPVGTVLLDDVTLSNAGLREGTAVIVNAVTVYGARSVTLSGSSMATTSITPVTLRQALLGKVMTVGDAVSLLPRDLGPGTSASAATRSLAAAEGGAFDGCGASCPPSAAPPAKRATAGWLLECPPGCPAAVPALIACSVAFNAAHLDCPT